MTLRIYVLAAVLCGCGDTPPDEATEAPVEPTTTETASDPACDAVVTSACGDPGSVLQGTIRLAADLGGPTTGDLYIALAHEAYAGATGGGYHIDTVLSGVDLTEPVPFMLDMCDGGAMWSEENCTYSLQVILDQNGNQSPDNLLPDPGEPSGRVGEIRVSCAEDAPCLDVVLDCTEGPACARFTELSSCSCEASTCGSDFALCNG